jgi:hypothetical protein
MADAVARRHAAITHRMVQAGHIPQRGVPDQAAKAVARFFGDDPQS